MLQEWYLQSDIGSAEESLFKYYVLLYSFIFFYIYLATLLGV